MKFIDTYQWQIEVLFGVSDFASILLIRLLYQ